MEKRRLYWLITALFASTIGGLIGYGMYVYIDPIFAIGLGFILFCWTFAIAFFLSKTKPSKEK